MTLSTMSYVNFNLLAYNDDSCSLENMSLIPEMSISNNLQYSNVIQKEIIFKGCLVSE